MQHPPISTLFPYTTLFRSAPAVSNDIANDSGVRQREKFLSYGIKAMAAFPLSVDGGKLDRKSTRLNSSHEWISYAVFCLKKKININSAMLTVTHGDGCSDS